MQTFLRVHSEKIKGTLSGFDRVRFRGTLRMIAYADGMSRFLTFWGILLKAFREWSMDLTDRIRRASAELAHSHGRPLLYVPSCNTDKDEIVREIAERDGITEGLICVLTCVESCHTFGIHRNKHKKILELQPEERRCMHQYFYIQHPQFGLMHLRVETWLPFTVHININGREWLANQLQEAGVSYEQRDNCFVEVGDLDLAQSLLDEQLKTNWETVLGDLVREYHPLHSIAPEFQQHEYYWSADETEWATDVMFHRAQDLAKLYPGLVRHSVTHVGCQDVLRYLGRAGTVKQYRAGEITTSILTRREGTRCKHSLNGNSVKMYDKQQELLRIETTINNTRQMMVLRPVESDPQRPLKWQKLRKGVADLHRRAELSQAANRRYLEDLASVEHDEPLGQMLAEAAHPTTHNGRRVRALNPFRADDVRLLQAVNHAEFSIHGFRNADIRSKLFGDRTRPPKTKTGRRQSQQVTRWLRLLRAHHLIKKIPRTHRYTLTTKGRAIITATLAAQQASTKQLVTLAV